MNSEIPEDTSSKLVEPKASQHKSFKKKFADYSIKKKLVILTMFSTLTTLMLALTAIINLDRMLTKANMVEEVKAISQILAVRSEVALTFSDKRSSQSNLDSLKNSPEYVLACLYGQNNELYAKFPSSHSQSNCPKEPPQDLSTFESVTSNFIHQWTEISRNNQEQIGHLYMRRSLNSLNERLAQFSIASAGITFLVIIIGYMIIGRLQRIISKPILDLSAISVKIAQDNDYQRRAIIAGEDEIGTLSHAFNKMLDTIEKTQKELTFMAFYDALTGLPNRRYFMETLERSMTSVSRGHRSIALFLIDLDGFKGVNDTIGHDAGDMVLTTVSERMPKLLRKSDMVARLGGDEFTIIISDIFTPETIRKIALQIIAAIEEPIEFKGKRADVSASIGIARAPTDATSMESVLKLADAAMYRAKAGGKKTFYFYDEEVDKNMKAFGEIEARIKSQLAKKACTLKYQPILNIVSLEIQGIVLNLDFNFDNTETNVNTSFSTIRHLVEIKLADQMLTQILEMLIDDIAQLSKYVSHYQNFQLILPITNAHLRSEHFGSKLQQLTQQLNVNSIHLLFAVDRGGLDKLHNQEFQNQLILSDDGNGIENLGAIEDIKNGCLATLPQKNLSDWEKIAWQNLVQSSIHSGVDLIAMNMNTQKQKNQSLNLGIELAAGDLLCQQLPIEELTLWLRENGTNDGKKTKSKV